MLTFDGQTRQGELTRSGVNICCHFHPDPYQQVGHPNRVFVSRESIYENITGNTYIVFPAHIVLGVPVVAVVGSKIVGKYWLPVTDSFCAVGRVRCCSLYKERVVEISN